MKKIALCNRIVVILVQIIAAFEIFAQKKLPTEAGVCFVCLFTILLTNPIDFFSSDQFFSPSVGFMPSKTILCPIERASASFSEVFTVQRITGSFVLIGNSPI